MSLDQCHYLEFPVKKDQRGCLSFLEANHPIPFEIKRVFYCYQIPAGETRGAHAHRELQQVMVCLAGSCQVELDDGQRKQSFVLDQAWQGLYIAPRTWTQVSQISPGTVYMVLADQVYREEDYWRDYQEFLRQVRDAN